MVDALRSDVAVKYVDQGAPVAWIGRVVRIRRKHDKGYTEWYRPVNLEDNAIRETVFVSLCFYADQGGGVFRYGVVDAVPVSLACVICPVKLTPTQDVAPEYQSIIKNALAGARFWEPA